MSVSLPLAVPTEPRPGEQKLSFNAESQTQEQLIEDAAPKASARAITVNFITGGLGSAIFSLPWSVAGSSIIPAMIIVALVLLLNGWTISIIVRAAEKYQAFDLGSLISHLPGGIGPPLQVATNIFVWISMFLCLVSYMIVIHDSAAKFVVGTFLDSRIIIVSVASAVVLPLCFVPMKYLEKTSSVAVGINLYLFVLVAVFYFQKAQDGTLPEETCLLGVSLGPHDVPRGFFSMITVMFQAVIIQMCVLPMYQELENRSPEKFDKIVAVGFGTLFFIFCGFSVVGYLLYGPHVSSDILDNLPHNLGSSIAKVGVIFVITCVYPIMVYPMIAPLHNSNSEMLAGPRRGAAIAIAKCVCVGGALVVALFVKKLGFINVLNGAMSAGIFVALVPSVVGFLLLDVGPCYKVALLFLLIGGLCVSAAGFVFSDNYLGDLKCYISA